jgi:hypothetical protein
MAPAVSLAAARSLSAVVLSSSSSSSSTARSSSDKVGCTLASVASRKEFCLPSWFLSSRIGFLFLSSNRQCGLWFCLSIPR